MASAVPVSALASSVSPFSPARSLTPSLQVLVLGSLFVSFRPSSLRSHSCSTSACLLFRFRFSSGIFRIQSRFLSSARPLLPATQPSVSSFPFFPFLPHSGLSGAASPLSLPCFPRSFPAGFPSVLSRFSYLAFCWFPFVLPCFAPAAVPQVIPFQIAPPGPVPDFRFLIKASVLASHYSASVSSVQFFPFSPHSGFPGAQFRSRFPGFPFLSDPISRAFLPGSRTRLPVCFLSSFPVSLPQLFHWCFPSFPLSLLFRAFPFPLGFFRPLRFRF